jgi:ribose transport system permease protein
MAIVGVLAIGQSLVAISGGILDLSVPTALILPAWIVTILLGRGINTVLVALVALATGAAWGLLNALIIVYGKLNPIIVTLGTNFAGAAILVILFQSAETSYNSSLAKFGQGESVGLPNIFWLMLALVLLVGYFLPRTLVGRRTYAVGGNPQAAKARGISLRKTRFTVFVASGFLSGVAGLLFAASNLYMIPSDGTTYLLPTIAAVILAGVSLGGGSGNVWLLLLSVGFLSTIPTALVFFGLNQLWQQVPPGAILVATLAIDGYRQIRARR